MSAQRPVPPAWVLSIPVATFGLVAGFIIVTLPQMLAALGVPGGRIPVAVAVITSPGFWAFFLAPFLDVRFRRRTYALVFGFLAVSGTAVTVLYHPSKLEMEAVMTLAFLSLALYGAAVGGWVGALIEKDQNSKLGAWNTIFNICSGGLGVLLSGYFTQHFSPELAAALVFVIFLSPMITFVFIPAPPPDDVLASESFLRFSREVISLFRRREILVALTMFTLPSASFTLTNTLGGWGKHFHASPALVSISGGVGGVVAGVVGSLLIPPIARRFRLRPMYLAVGIIGACFTLSLLLLPRVPITYALAFLGENTFQAAAFTTGFAIIFQVIGKDNPLAATIFAVLTSAMNLPIIYMEVIDGHGFDWNGVTGAFVTDALISGSICILLWLVLQRSFKARASRDVQPGI